MRALEAISRSFIFSGLRDEEMAELRRLLVEKEFGPGQFIFWEGDQPAWFYIVAEGRVKALKQTSSGREFIVAFFGLGEMFGEVAVFENKPYPASAQAAARTKVLGIQREDFIGFLGRNPEISLRIISILGGRLRDAQNRLRDLAGEKVEQRMARLLLMLHSRLGPSLPFTRSEIADMAGTATETAIRCLSGFQKKGIVRSVRGRITIRDEAGLRALSES